MEIAKKKVLGATPNDQCDVDAYRLCGSSRREDGSSTSGDEGESWLGAFEGGLFEEDEQLEERCREAVAFAANRQGTGWRLSHDELYDKSGLGRVDTAMGAIHFERGQGQQGRAWDCSLVLVKYLESRPEEVRGKGVLELGCGVGLPGVAAAIAGAGQVILTDMAEGLPVIERTIDLNPAVAGRISGEVLLWGDEAAAERLLRTRARLPVSVVLCSDLLYGDGPPEEEESVVIEKDVTTKDGAAAAEKRKALGAAETLAITLSAVCSLSSATEETLILSCYERRWSGDQGAFFFELLARKGFSTIETVNLGDIDERYRRDCGISLMRIRRE